jgi:hypothetical protein
MKRVLCLLLAATLPFASVLADAPKSKNAEVTLVYQYELPNVPGKSIKGVLVEYGQVAIACGTGRHPPARAGGATAVPLAQARPNHRGGLA